MPFPPPGTIKDVVVDPSISCVVDHYCNYGTTDDLGVTSLKVGIGATAKGLYAPTVGTLVPAKCAAGYLPSGHIRCEGGDPAVGAAGRWMKYTARCSPQDSVAAPNLARVEFDSSASLILVSFEASSEEARAAKCSGKLPSNDRFRACGMNGVVWCGASCCVEVW